MAKLSTARDFRKYGPPTARNCWEYFNAGIYILAAGLLAGGFAAQQSPAGVRSGLIVVVISLFLIACVNAHDHVAHLAGIDFSLVLLRFDAQLAFVELAASFFFMLGDFLAAIAVVFLLIQEGRGFYTWRLEKSAVNLLIAGPVFWLIGSVQNLCQVYERSSGHIQILQKSVQIPFLMGSLLFLVAGIFNRHDILGQMIILNFKLVSKSWIWLSLFGSLFFLIGGLMNALKVFKMQQMRGSCLENLRGGALERLVEEREGRVPLILEGSKRNQASSGEKMPDSTSPISQENKIGGESTATYKDVLVGGT